MNIKLNQILKYLEENSIEFIIHGDVKEEYKVCSAFYPEPNGFYFMEDDILLENYYYKGSLFLVKSKKREKKDCTFLEVRCSPQILYYEILNFYFRDSSNGQICNSAIINEKAVIGKNVQIDSFVVIGECKIGDDTIIKSHSIINNNCTIGEKVIIEPNCTIGATGMVWIWNRNGKKVTQPQLGGVSIGNNCIIGANSVIVRGSLNENTSIGENTIMAPGARLGHGCQIGKNVHLANNVVTAGNSVIKDNCFLGSSVTLRPKVRLHKNTTVGAGAVVVKNTTAEGLTLMGVPARETESKERLSGIPVNFKHRKPN